MWNEDLGEEVEEVEIPRPVRIPKREPVPA